MEIKASVLDYIGKYEGGILVSVGLMFNEKYYNSIFYYTSDEMIINVEESMTKEMGFEIELHKDYLDLLKSILQQCDLYENIIDKLEEIKTNNE
jgi:hypothetical protein